MLLRNNGPSQLTQLTKWPVATVQRLPAVLVYGDKRGEGFYTQGK